MPVPICSEPSPALSHPAAAAACLTAAAADTDEDWGEGGVEDESL